MQRLAEAGFCGTVVLAVASSAERAFYERTAMPEGLTLEVRVDSTEHRGAGGTIGDVWRERRGAMTEAAQRGGIVLIEASKASDLDFPRFLAAIDSTQGALIGAALNSAPAGAMWIAGAALELGPAIGFFDLKEQLIPAIVASGMSVAACVGAQESCRISDRLSYLKAIALMLASGAPAQAADAILEPGCTVRGNSIVCRGAVVERGALVVDSAILPGARVCADAVVARSVVPPGTHVPCGYLVVDEIFGALGSPEKSGTEGSS